MRAVGRVVDEDRRLSKVSGSFDGRQVVRSSSLVNCGAGSSIVASFRNDALNDATI